MATARYLESDERAKLLAQLHSTRDRLLWILGINTGFRITELLSLRWRDVWRVRGEGPRGLISGANIQQRFTQRGTTVATFFEDIGVAHTPPTS